MIITDILHYDIHLILDDYIHCIQHHEYYEINNYLQASPEYLCNIDECSFLSRNHRDKRAMIKNNEISNRMKLYLSASDSFNVATMQILDKIHCYLLHSFVNKEKHKTLKKTKIFNTNLINLNDIRFNEIEPEYSMDAKEIVL